MLGYVPGRGREGEEGGHKKTEESIPTDDLFRQLICFAMLEVIC